MNGVHPSLAREAAAPLLLLATIAAAGVAAANIWFAAGVASGTFADLPLTAALPFWPLSPSPSFWVIIAWNCALAGPGATFAPGRTFCNPSAMTCSPCCKPLMTPAKVVVDWPTWMRRCSTVLSEPTT